ncbi:NADH-quinone oxidoreductase subunit J family protein [Limnochorda pilosa]|uniref:NADH-quinone oxidoreductase subunit J n=1 Tax=Limnochorda pilosa TaxID=1555112 RepID=A0A0K2SKZ7_LIMPI|nr:NADH-quinone oxidoreductase subunit J [Limnochorda pilosa]BAS27667.1 NADH:ubiquinone oxidoreductase subunit J [Limnochorda pilosa]
MSLDLLAFIALGLVTLIAAYLVVASDNLMHAALFLGLSFVGVAGIYLILGAEFLAAAQILIYVGAITTLIVFGIMLSDLRDIRGGERRVWARVWQNLVSFRRGALPLLVSAGFAILMLLVYRQGAWPAEPPAASGANLGTVGNLLFSEYAIPFEIASVVLLVALIGAVALSRRDEAETPPVPAPHDGSPASARKEDA